jgi:hypothetical protein
MCAHSSCLLSRFFAPIEFLQAPIKPHILESKPVAKDHSTPQTELQKFDQDRNQAEKDEEGLFRNLYPIEEETMPKDSVAAPLKCTSALIVSKMCQHRQQHCTPPRKKASAMLLQSF